MAFYLWGAANWFVEFGISLFEARRARQRDSLGATYIAVQ